MQPEIGVVLAGRYRLDHRLGQGGMGEVWAATQILSARAVALKLIRATAEPHPDLRKRFTREVEAVAAVQHPNVVELYDVFELEPTRVPVMVMPLLRGETLGKRLARQTALELDVVADLGLQIVSAVGTCHAAGIVHRDLKPDNIFLTEHGGECVVKVLDFGVAKLARRAPEDSVLTHSGAMLGTPCYMAPEQAFGEPDVDHRADIWSIGAILYEALTGGRPVEGENLGQVLKRMLREVITPIEVLVPDLPTEVSELIMQMLAREAQDRPEDLRPVHATLLRYARRPAPDFGPAHGAPEPGASSASERPPVASVNRPEPPRRPTPTKVYVAFGAAAVAALASVAYARPTSKPPRLQVALAGVMVPSLALPERTVAPASTPLTASPPALAPSTVRQRPTPRTVPPAPVEAPKSEASTPPAINSAAQGLHEEVPF